MSRRANLPGADELFRSTGGGPSTAAAALGAEPEAGDAGESGEASSGAARPRHGAVRRRPRPTADRRPTGRERHDEKITVYISADELLDLEHARLTLRADHGLAVDRGRIVREALAVVLADLDAKGDASILVRRLRSL